MRRTDTAQIHKSINDAIFHLQQLNAYIGLRNDQDIPNIRSHFQSYLLASVNLTDRVNRYLKTSNRPKVRKSKAKP